MPKEIERKFSVKNTRMLNGRLGSRIVQGYLVDSPVTVRVRIIEAESFLTIKGKSQTIERDEYEFPIPISYAREILQQYCGTRIIEKTRYRVPHQGLIFEVDIFAGRLAGLVIAEVELDSVDQTFGLPDWIGIELTQDHRFSNSSLSLAEQAPLIP